MSTPFYSKPPRPPPRVPKNGHPLSQSSPAGPSRMTPANARYASPPRHHEQGAPMTTPPPVKAQMYPPSRPVPGEADSTAGSVRDDGSMNGDDEDERKSTEEVDLPTRGPGSIEEYEIAELKVAIAEFEKASSDLRGDYGYVCRAWRVQDDATVGKNEKKIFLLRHGQGYHNVAQREWRNSGRPDEPYSIKNDPDYNFVDPPLTDVGLEQALGLMTRFGTMDPQLLPQIAFISPMRCPLATAHISCPPWWPKVAFEALRERCGIHTCDKRLSKSKLKQLYKDIEYDFIYEDDDLWYPDYRESRHMVAIRASKFIAYLRDRPESRILIVSHAEFLLALLNTVLTVDNPRERTAFGNAEMRAYICTWEDAPLVYMPSTHNTTVPLKNAIPKSAPPSSVTPLCIPSITGDQTASFDESNQQQAKTSFTPISSPMPPRTFQEPMTRQNIRREQQSFRVDRQPRIRTSLQRSPYTSSAPSTPIAARGLVPPRPVRTTLPLSSALTSSAPPTPHGTTEGVGNTIQGPFTQTPTASSGQEFFDPAPPSSANPLSIPPVTEGHENESASFKVNNQQLAKNSFTSISSTSGMHAHLPPHPNQGPVARQNIRREQQPPRVRQPRVRTSLQRSPYTSSAPSTPNATRGVIPPRPVRTSTRLSSTLISSSARPTPHGISEGVGNNNTTQGPFTQTPMASSGQEFFDAA